MICQFVSATIGCVQTAISQTITALESWDCAVLELTTMKETLQDVG